MCHPFPLVGIIIVDAGTVSMCISHVCINILFQEWESCQFHLLFFPYLGFVLSKNVAWKMLNHCRSCFPAFAMAFGSRCVARIDK